MDPSSSAAESIFPQAFAGDRRSAGAAVYLGDPLVRRLVEFFEAKGLAAVKEEDRLEAWYEDWQAFQSDHQIYARLLSPRRYSSLGTEFDLLRYTRFLEAFAYFSAAHGYSLQVTFLGLSAILMGANDPLKKEAVAALEAGGLLAFGVSERGHGSDLLANEMTVTDVASGRLNAAGEKYYIGNAHVASIISILGRKAARDRPGRAARASPILFALRQGASSGLKNVRKIRTIGVRAAYVGAFEVRDHELPGEDVIAEGRRAWEAIFGTVTLGKFFLGFGSIGMCERAFQEATAHLRTRILYARPAIDMPHIRETVAQAYARLTAMKLYAYRALDYVHAAGAADRRFLLFAAVQKAKLSTEGVKVMALLSECIGARGYESETYFEMALRDVQLIPSLEGSSHINLGLTSQFVSRYFNDPDRSLAGPPSLVAAEAVGGENPYLMELNTGAIPTIGFPHFLGSYGPLISVANVRLFARATAAFQRFIQNRDAQQSVRADTPDTLAVGRCLATIAYGQLVAENAVRLGVSTPMVAAMFHALVSDFSAAALSLASSSGSFPLRAALFRRMVVAPVSIEQDIIPIIEQMAGSGGSDGRTG